MSVDAILRDLDETDFGLMNLFEIKRGHWQANVRKRKAAPNKSGDPRHDPLCHEFGRGATAEAALKAAIEKAGIGEVEEEEYDI